MVGALAQRATSKPSAKSAVFMRSVWKRDSEFQALRKPDGDTSMIWDSAI
jgi:hypothetical protein